MAKVITVKMLEEKDACPSGIATFKRYCGDEIEVTIHNAKAFGRFLDVDWASENLLNEKQEEAYREAIEPLRKAYEEAREPLWKAYEEAIEPLRKAYEEARGSLWEAYEEAEAIEFVKAYKESKYD